MPLALDERADAKAIMLNLSKGLSKKRTHAELEFGEEDGAPLTDDEEKKEDTGKGKGQGKAKKPRQPKPAAPKVDGETLDPKKVTAESVLDTYRSRRA